MVADRSRSLKIASALLAVAQIALVAIVLRHRPKFFSANAPQQTVRDMRTIGEALEEYAHRKHQYPRVFNIDDLAVALRQDIPKEDGWGIAFRYTPICSRASCTEYRLASAGSDRRFTIRPREVSEGATYEVQRTDIDIIHANGHFILLPDALRETND
jgi:hypothetical protein